MSDADNVEEILLDIEDFVREEVGKLSATSQPLNSGEGKNEPVGHETPPAIQSGIPAPAPAQNLEETENLHGTDLSRAVLRNSIKKMRGVK